MCNAYLVRNIFVLYDKKGKMKWVCRLVIFLSFLSNTHKRAEEWIKCTLIRNKNINLFAYQKPLIRTFHTRFWLQITFVNTQHMNTNLNGEFVLKTGLKRSFYRFQVYKNKSESKIYIKCTLTKGETLWFIKI